MGIDHNKRLKEHLYYYSARISRDMSNLIKWLVLAVVTGCIVGAASTLFSFVMIDPHVPSLLFFTVCIILIILHFSSQ